jgi:hypothetical protein
MNGIKLPIVTTSDASGAGACARVSGGLTDREVTLLSEMRDLKASLRSASPDHRPSLTSRLKALKLQRAAARAERMALLGYDP